VIAARDGDDGLPQRRRQAWGETQDSGEVPDGGRGGRNARLSELEVVNVKLHLPGAATQAAETDATQEQAGSGARWAVLRDERLHDADGEEEESVEDEEGGGGDDVDEDMEQDEEDLAVPKEGGHDVDSMDMASARDTARQVLARDGSHNEGRGVSGGLEEGGQGGRKELIGTDPDLEPLPAVSRASKAPRAIYNKDDISSEESNDE
jgi:hypothetical protein